jgi:hypothetical protein
MAPVPGGCGGEDAAAGMAMEMNKKGEWSSASSPGCRQYKSWVPAVQVGGTGSTGLDGPNAHYAAGHAPAGMSARLQNYSQLKQNKF